MAKEAKKTNSAGAESSASSAATGASSSTELDAVLERWEPVIGLEVHAQLLTRSKLFCSCSTAFGAPPNTQVCPICLGHPGVLPVLNRRAVALAIRMALATGCSVREHSVFARKNYFYPDLPKNYQISQYDRPLAEGGALTIQVNGEAKRVRIHRIHLEEDAGKSKHPERAGESESRIDLNRCGTPLIEIVSEPDLRSAAEAHAYLATLKQLLEYTGVCDGNMEEGSLRCDANVSIRPRDTEPFGTRTELKNLNSFRFVEKAINYEIARQARVLDAGGTIEQETLLWEPALGRTRTMRGKEDAHDYRYFPDPDLPALVVPAAWIEEERAALPELPEAKRARLAASYGLPDGDLEVLVNFPEIAAYFESVVSAGCEPRVASNWIVMELLGQLNKRGLTIEQSPVPPREMIELVSRLSAGRLSGKLGKMALEECLDTGASIAAIIEAHGWEVVSDDSAIQAFIDQVLAAAPEKVEEYRGGKEHMFRWFVGQVMKLSKAQVAPARTEELLRAVLDRKP